MTRPPLELLDELRREAAGLLTTADVGTRAYGAGMTGVLDALEPALRAQAETNADMTECPTCEGEGVTRETLPARWEPIVGTFIPDEREVPCEDCGGTGEMEEE